MEKVRNEYLDYVETKYGIDIEDFLKLFYKGKSQKEIADILGLTRKIVRRIGYALNLDWNTRKKADTVTIDKYELLKYRYSILQRNYNRLSQLSTIDQLWLDKLSSFLSSKNNKLEIRYKVINRPERIPKYEDKEKVLLLSDWHIGEKVDIHQTKNKYDLEQAERRINLLFDLVCEELDYYNGNLHVFVLGDMVEGGIHDDLLSDEQNVFEYVMFVAKKLYEFALSILTSNKAKHITFYTVVGNHSRIKERRYYKNKYVTFESFAYHTLSLLLQQSPLTRNNTKFVFNKENIGIVEIQNHKIAYLHGDIMQSDKQTDINKLQTIVNHLFNTQFNSVVYGHWHIPKIVMNNWKGYSIRNGSLKGVDEYALFNNIGIFDPAQIIFSVSPKRGIQDISILTLTNP